MHSTRDDIAGHAIAARDRGGAALGTDRSTSDLGRFAEPALLILVSLADTPKHGYAIMTDVNAFASSPIGPGTLYGALARLERRGLVATDGGKIFATDDAGESWRLVRYGRSLADHLFDLDFVDRWNGWAVGLGGVLRTRDGGETWTEVIRSVSENGYLSGFAIHFFDESNGCMVGQNGSVMSTSDGGASWSPVLTPLPEKSAPSLRDLFFVDERNGWAVGDEGAILHTSDAGQTWGIEDTGIAEAKSEPRLERIQRGSRVEELDLGDRTAGLSLSAVRFVDPQHGWVTGYFSDTGRSLVLRTGDGGATWTVEARVEGEELRALFVMRPARAWAVGDRVREGRQVLLRRRPPEAEAAKPS